MKELSRFQMAAIKRTAQNVKSMRVRKAKLETKIQSLISELDPINEAIDSWEEPIKKLTGGYTSEEVLSGHYGEEDSSKEEEPASEITKLEEPSQDEDNHSVNQPNN